MHKEGRHGPRQPGAKKLPPETGGRRCLLDQQLRDLDGVGGGALSHLVAAAPQAQTVVIGAQKSSP